MKRFIFLTFGFLGFAFYELSGGSDFDPLQARNAIVETRVSKESTVTVTPLVANAEAARPAPAPEDLDGPTVTRASLNLTSFKDVVTPKAPTQADVQTVALDVQVDEEPQKILPSIIFSGNILTASSDDVQPERDIRFVSANSVNLRAGPGTTHGIVTRLELDTQVEILADNGNGWVQLRPIDGGPTGWMADFLLTDG